MSKKLNGTIPMAKVVFLCLLVAGANAQAARIAAQVADASGAAIADAAVYALPLSGSAPSKSKREAAIEQVKKEFVPLVTVVQTGTAVTFPNRDAFRHHVYSFSPAKTFEIKLYSGVPGQPVVFDKPGEIVLGCNIHDNMLAYVYVVDTPYFGKTDNQGKLTLDNLPAGDYEIRLQHYASAAPVESQKLKLKSDDSPEVRFSVALKPRAPGK